MNTNNHFVKRCVHFLLNIDSFHILLKMAGIHRVINESMTHIYRSLNRAYTIVLHYALGYIILHMYCTIVQVTTNILLMYNDIIYSLVNTSI